MSNRDNVVVLDASKDPSDLLRHDEVIPDGVAATVTFFEKHDLWYLLSRNPPVLSCREAASRRYRLGHRGIDLSDELRSYWATASSDSGEKCDFLFHCRGSSLFDFDKIQSLEGLAHVKLSKGGVVENDENEVEFQSSEIGYGLINPFVAPDIIGSMGSSVVQIFDVSTLEKVGETQTMMTNAGERTWAIEFFPFELINTLGTDFAQVGAISNTTDTTTRAIRPIGILTGNSPDSGALLWKKVNQEVKTRLANEFKGDVSYPRVIIHSLPAMGWSMELSDRSEQLLALVTDEVKEMSKNGAGPIAFACNTTQYYSKEIDKTLQGSSSTFVSAANAVQHWLENNSGTTVFLAGIGHVTASSKWSAFNKVLDNPNIKLPNSKQSRLINDLAYEVKRDVSSGIVYQKFRSIMRSIDAEVCILLLTELSTIFSEYPRTPMHGVRIVDALDLYANEIVNAAEQP